MDYRVIFSRPALRDLGQIARYIAKDNPAAAERVGLQLLALSESLKALPRRGRELKGLPGVRQLVHKSYLISYRIAETDQCVYILRFWHSKRDPLSWNPDQ